MAPLLRRWLCRTPVTFWPRHDWRTRTRRSDTAELRAAAHALPLTGRLKQGGRKRSARKDDGKRGDLKGRREENDQISEESETQDELEKFCAVDTLCDTLKSEPM